MNDLNHKFGIQPQNSEPCPDVSESNVEVLNPKTGQKLEVRSLCPRLLIYPLKYEDERRQQSSPEPGSSSSTGDRGSSPNDATSLRRSSNETLNQFIDLDEGFSLFKTEVAHFILMIIMMLVFLWLLMRISFSENSRETDQHDDQ